MAQKIEVKNKRAFYEFFITDEVTAGIMLSGTEIKSIRTGKVNITDAYCTFVGDELFIRNMYIAEYEYGSYNAHEPRRDRKLLMTARELAKYHNKIKDKGLTIVALRLFTNEKGLAKIDIALAKGKKLYDKRASIKDKDVKRDMEREQY
ncbi:MAG: SsrA-binding protein SmpB [Bacteroidales bacterium]|nr:SsrA-binding protein SmpB [Bacteroidales bacterium]